MKTKNFMLKTRYIIGAFLLAVCCFKGNAQDISDKLQFSVDWQMNAPLGTDFANKISGWGMNFEGGYYLTPHWSLGAFLNFHTNHKYVGRQTYQLSPTEALTTDQQQSAFQLPFGLSTAYRIKEDGYVRPYVGAKVGAMYAKNTTYMNVTGLYDNPWGFYVSPEVGIHIFPVPDRKLGFHVAAYYSYATNQSKLLLGSMDGQNNIGFRVGLTF